MIRYFFRHQWEAMKSLKRNFWMTFASISTVTLTLTLLGIFAAVLLNTERLATGIENNIRINVYLDVDSTDNQETVKDESGKEIPNEKYQLVKKSIEELKGVSSVIFSSKDEQLTKLQETAGDEWKLFDGDSNPLQDVYVVEADTPSDVKKAAKAIEKLDGVESVNYGGSDSDNLFKMAKIIRTWGLIGTAMLIFVAIFLISNTIRITIISRRRDIEIMRLVGAKNSYIRGPFFYEGSWVGLLGSLVPAALVYIIYTYVYSEFNMQLEVQGLSLYPDKVFVPAMIGGLLVIGVVIGSIGSVLSMRRYLKF